MGLPPHLFLLLLLRSLDVKSLSLVIVGLLGILLQRNLLLVLLRCLRLTAKMGLLSLLLLPAGLLLLHCPGIPD